MSKYDFSNYKAKRDQIPVKLKSRIQEINAGSEPAAVKAWMIEKAKESSKADNAKLRSEFNNYAATYRENLLKPKATKPTRRDIIRKQAEESEQYPTLYNDSMLADAQLEIFEKILSHLERAEMRDRGKQGDDRFFTKALEGNDPDILAKYQEHGLPYLPAEARDRLEGAYSSRIEKLREQQIPQAVKEFDDAVYRFDTSYEVFDRDGYYPSYGESPPEPENETVLHDVSSRGMQQVQGNGSAEG